MKPTQEFADHILIMRCQLRDRQAFAELIDRYQRPLRYFIARLVARPEVTLGGLAMAFVSESGMNPVTYTFARTVAVADGTGARTVMVSAVDLAGNVTSAGAGSIEVDQTTPGVAPGTIWWSVSPPPGALVSSVSRVSVGGKARLRARQVAVRGIRRGDHGPVRLLEIRAQGLGRGVDHLDGGDDPRVENAEGEADDHHREEDRHVAGVRGEPIAEPPADGAEAGRVAVAGVDEAEEGTDDVGVGTRSEGQQEHAGRRREEPGAVGRGEAEHTAENRARTLDLRPGKRPVESAPHRMRRPTSG